MAAVNLTKLSKLIRMLGSDQPAEIVAAAGALKRALASAGLDLHDLASAAVRGFQRPAEARAMPSSPPPDPFDWEKWEDDAAERRYWDRRFDELRERYAREEDG